jgi:hypothetical protein
VLWGDPQPTLLLPRLLLLAPLLLLLLPLTCSSFR